MYAQLWAFYAVAILTSEELCELCLTCARSVRFVFWPLTFAPLPSTFASDPVSLCPASWNPSRFRLFLTLCFLSSVLDVSSSTELLTKILVFAAESAADAALALSSSPGEHMSTNSETTTMAAAGASESADARSTSIGWITPQRSGGVGGGVTDPAGMGRGENMSDFRRRATGALHAARSMADQRGMDPHDVETIIFRLAKGWICQQKLGAGGAAAGERDAGMFVGAGLRGGGGGGESVFVKDAREVRARCRCCLLSRSWLTSVRTVGQGSRRTIDESLRRV